MRHGSAILAIMALLGATPAAFAIRAGDLDETFGTAGVVRTDLGGDDNGEDVVVLPDGRILVVGFRNSGGTFSVLLARYDANGALDSTFGTGGTFVTSCGGSCNAFGLAVQGDGRILVAGTRVDGGMPRIMVLRVLPDGGLDPDFGTAGMVTTASSGDGNDRGNAVTLDASGRVIVVGTRGAPSTTQAVVLRFDASGTPDPVFDADGEVTVAAPEARGNDVLVQPDGRIVVVGVSIAADHTRRILLARLLSDGAPDPTLAGDGIELTSFPGLGAGAVAVVRQPDGKLVAGGGTSGANAEIVFAMARYEVDGSLDATFGVGGRVVTDVPGLVGDTADGLLLAPDGTLVQAGFALGGSLHVAVARVDADGIADPTFGSAGVVDTDVSPEDDFAADLARQADGRLLVVGTARNGGDGDVMLVRYVAVGDEIDPTPTPTPTPAPECVAPCVCLDPAQIMTSKLTVGHLGPPAGDETLTFKGTAAISAAPPFDPVSSGIRLVLQDASGATIADVTLPPGAYDAVTRAGWSATSTTWRFRNRGAAAATGGVHKVTLKRLPAGQLAFRVSARAGSFPVTAGSLPLRAWLVVAAPLDASDRCALISYSAADCAIVPSGRTANCR